VDAATANLSAMTYWLKFENGAQGAPAVNLFEAVDETLDYLTSHDTATKQLQKVLLLTVDSKEVQVPSHLVKPDGQVMPFLLEGRRAGTGDLVLIARCAGAEIARSSIRLTLKEPSEFCQTFEVNTTLGDMVQTEAIQKGPYTYTPANNGEYVLYVHGWNMEEYEKDRWTQTVFKRLWWLGYKGHVGAFQWPTRHGGGVLAGLHYNQSEHRAWSSATALSDLLGRLHRDFPERVRLLAHSMGNVVAGEALRIAQGKVVHSYIAAQAAIPAHCYDNSQAPYWDSWTTPNLFGHFPGGASSDLPFFADNYSKTIHGLFNYFNEDDLALRAWKINNITKPDYQNNAYGYIEGDGSTDTYNPSSGDRFLKYGLTLNRTLVLPKDRFEAFAYGVESRSLPLGAVTTASPGVGRLTAIDLK